MSRKGELFKNTIIISIGKISTQFISFLLVPLYTSQVSVSDYGYIDLIQAYVSLLIPIIILRFDSAVFRFLIDVRKQFQKQIRIISTAVLIIVLELLLIVSVSFLIHQWFDIRFFYAILLNIICLAGSQIALQVSRGIGSNISYAIGSIVSALTNITCSFLFVYILKMGGEGILLSSSIANLICILYLFFNNKMYQKISIKGFDKRTLGQMLKYSLPMIPDGISWWMINTSDRTIISMMISMTANGFYAISSKFSNILMSVFQIFSMSWQENAAIHMNDEDADVYFSEVIDDIFRIFYSICLLLLSSMYIIFKIFVDPSYNEAYTYIPILLISNVFNAIASAIGSIYTAKKETLKVAKTTITAAIMNIITHVLLVRFIGIYAAAVSTLLSCIYIMLYRLIDIRKYVKIELDKKLYILSSFAFLFLVVIYYSNNLFLQTIGLLLTVVVVYFLNRKAAQKIFSLTKNLFTKKKEKK